MILEYLTDYHFVGIALALLMLGIACILDVWKREIHDYFWIKFGSVGFLALFMDPEIIPNLMTVAYALIIAPVAIMLWRLGLFGGADAFALIALAVIAPVATLSENTITPFTTLSNAAILFVVPVLFNVVRNVISKSRGEQIFQEFEEGTGKKLAAMLIGYRAKNPKFGFAIETTQNGKKKFDLGFHHAESSEFCKKPNTWITPGVPYLLLIAGGFLIQLFYGDIIIGRFLGV